MIAERQTRGPVGSAWDQSDAPIDAGDELAAARRRATWPRRSGGVFENPLMHTSTFGGNARACAAGLKPSGSCRTTTCVARSRDRGALMLALLRRDAGQALATCVVDVHGRGLMIGVEFARDEVAELTVVPGASSTASARP